MKEKKSLGESWRGHEARVSHGTGQEAQMSHVRGEGALVSHKRGQKAQDEVRGNSDESQERTISSVE
jgi:hypothetical protein